MSVGTWCERRQNALKLTGDDRLKAIEEIMKDVRKYEDPKCTWCLKTKEETQLNSWMCCTNGFFCNECLTLENFPAECPGCHKEIGGWWARESIWPRYTSLEFLAFSTVWATFFCALSFFMCYVASSFIFIIPLEIMLKKHPFSYFILGGIYACMRHLEVSLHPFGIFWFVIFVLMIRSRDLRVYGPMKIIPEIKVNSL